MAHDFTTLSDLGRKLRDFLGLSPVAAKAERPRLLGRRGYGDEPSAEPPTAPEESRR